MKQKRVFVMCGVSGSGKSAWIKTRIAQYGGYHISRDAIRFEMVKDDEEYFAHENAVYNEFIRRIQEEIAVEGFSDIYVDATHLNGSSRNKLMKSLDGLNGCYVIYVWFDVPLEICKYRNAQREGRARVPDDVLEAQFRRFRKPTGGYNELWVINMEGERVE